MMEDRLIAKKDMNLLKRWMVFGLRRGKKKAEKAKAEKMIDDRFLPKPLIGIEITEQSKRKAS